MAAETFARRFDLIFDRRSEVFVTINVTNPQTVALVRKLASRRGISLTEAVRVAVTNKLADDQQAQGQSDN